MEVYLSHGIKLFSGGEKSELQSWNINSDFIFFFLQVYILQFILNLLELNLILFWWVFFSLISEFASLKPFFFFAILKKDRFVRSKVVKFYLSVCLQVNKDSTQTFPYCPFKLAIKQTYRRWNIINILIDFNLICIIIFFTIKSPKKLISKIYKKYKCWISVYQPQS